MAVDPLQFQTPTAYSAYDWTPLGKLGQVAQKQNQDQLLANLASRYLQPTTPPVGGTITSSPLPPVGTGGTIAQFSAPPTTGDVNTAIKATAAAAGMDVPTWKAIASIESSLNPSSNFNRQTQFKGLFQLGRGVWGDHGSGNIYDATDNATAAAKFAGANNAWFKDQFGRDPTPTETYMMHQQGRGFYQKGTMTNVEGNPYPGMTGPQTPQSFAEGWGKEIERRANYFRKSEEVSNGDQSN